jgi:predicted metal-binding protein
MRSIVVCTTCRYSPDSKHGPDGRTGGEILAGHLLEAAAKRSAVEVETQICLWNCTRFCSVLVRDTERFSYVTGSHEPSQEQAEAILDWYEYHGATENGEVPFKQWPQRMRGHFIARIPPVKP